MAFSINKITLLGNVASDLELKYTSGGQAVLNFRIATNRSVKQGEEYKDVPTFHRIVVWGKLAEFLNKNLHKGAKVYVDGRMDNRSFQDQSGNTKYISEVVAKNVVPMVSRQESGQAAAPAQRGVIAEEAEQIMNGPAEPEKPTTTQGVITDPNDPNYDFAKDMEASSNKDDEDIPFIE